jgi:hypothetical protein
MQAFEAALAALFADPNIASDAIWRAGGVGGGIAVRVVTKRPDQLVGFGASRAVRPTVLIEVRVNDIAAPAIGDTVTVGSTVYTIIAEPVGDTLGLVWTCEANV